MNEFLCFLINKFGKLTRAQLKSTLLGFYAEDEISDAKDVLFADAGKLNIDDMPHMVKRTKGDNRARLMTDDVLDVCAFLDEKSCFGRLPAYVARYLDRVPTVKVEDMELFCVARRIEDMERRLAAVESINVDCLTTKLNQMCLKLDSHQSVINTAVGKLQQPTSEPLMLPEQAVNSGVDQRDQTVDPADDSGYTTVTYRRPRSSRPKMADTEGQTSRRTPTAIRLRGAKLSVSPDAAVRAIPRKPQQPVLAAFVGRLHRDTTAEQLTTYLMAEGMKGIVCRKLQAKNGHKFSTAAFHVTCCLDSKKLFYDEGCWPAGVELRDWVYK